jgi:hypothetical protein
MKISIIGPATQIPPIGWGAVECLIWDYKLSLEKLGHSVQIINRSNSSEIIQCINEFRPDFVHINYDDWIILYPYIQYPSAITSHFGYIERPDMMGGYVNIFNLFRDYKPNVFCLSESIKNVYKVFSDIPDDKLFITPNGVNLSVFRKVNKPKYADRSIYLAKVDYRKRQHLFQSIDSLWFAGNIADYRFDTSKNYLGEWDKQTVHKELTEYGNLVLLSDGEAHPLVCMEALAAGLGVVVCEWGKANLDTDKEFITVIPERKINDLKYVEDAIIKNREYSIAHRDEILEYAKEFEWTNVIEKYYLPSVKTIVERCK